MKTKLTKPDDLKVKYDRKTFGHLVRYQMMVQDNKRDEKNIKKYDENSNKME